MAIKPTLPKWIPNGEAARQDEPSVGKRDLGFIYKEKPPFQWFNWGFYNLSKWILGVQGSFFDIVVGSSTQVTDNEATNVIADLTDANVPTESRVLILDGTHTLAANMALSNTDLVVVSESPAAIVAVSTFQILMTGARQMLNLRVTGAGANDIQLSGAGSYFEGIDIDISFVQVSGGAHARTTGTNGGIIPLFGQDVANYVKGTTTYIEDDVGADSTAFDVDAVIGAAWESVGPTGSGATNIWTAMDSIPSTGKWVKFKIDHDCTDSGAGDINQSIYGRATGSSAGATIVARIARIRLDSSGATRIDKIEIVELPIDSANRFDIYFVIGGTSRVVDLFLIGFGA